MFVELGLRRRILLRHIVVLDPLTKAAATELLESCAPGATPEEVRRISERVGGIPAALIRASHATPSNVEAALHDQILTVLATLGRPLPVDVIAMLSDTDRASVSEVASLSSSVASSPAGIWLRRDSREATAPASSATRLRLATRLAATALDEPRLEAVDLFLLAGERDAALGLLSEFGESVCERGSAADLWTMLSRAVGQDAAVPEELKTWLAWCAFEWGDPRGHADIARFRATTHWAPTTYLSAHLAARLAIAVGEFDRAAVLARAAADLATADSDRDRAVCRAARAVFSAGRASEALEIVEQAGILSPGPQVEAELVRIESCAVLGRTPEAAALAERLLGRLSALQPAARLRAMLGGARAYLLLSRLRDAERAIEALLSLHGETAGDAGSARTALEIAAAVAIQRGHFRRVREVADRLLTFERAYPVRALFVRSYLVTCDRWQLPARAFRENIVRLDRAAGENRSPIARDISCYCAALLAQADCLEGIAPSARTFADSQPTPGLPTTRERYRQVHAARWGQALPPRDRPDDDDEADILHELGRGIAAIVEDDLSNAHPLLQSALERSIDSGRRLIEFDIRITLAQLAAIRGEWAHLTEQVTTLLDLGMQLDAARVTEVTEFFGSSRQADGPSPELLERWAGDDSGGPRMRWSQWLLGGEPALDHVDRAMLVALTSRHDWARARGLRDDAPMPGEPAPVLCVWHGACGADFTRRTVWMPDGAACDLSQHEVLWNLVAHLATRRGESTKEAMVCDVWNLTDYHPLHHDNRLRVAVRKLRDRLAVHGGVDARDFVGTSDDGYSLRGAWRSLVR